MKTVDSAKYGPLWTVKYVTTLLKYTHTQHQAALMFRIGMTAGVKVVLLI